MSAWALGVAFAGVMNEAGGCVEASQEPAVAHAPGEKQGEHSCEGETVEDDGLTALHVAAMNGHAETCASLAAAGAAVDASDDFGRTPLHYAAEGGHVTAAKRLLAAGANPNARDASGCTPLHALAAHHEEEVDFFRALAAAGADVNAVDEQGDTALHRAAEECLPTACAELLRLGADAHAAGGADAQTPLLRWLAIGENQDVPMELLKASPLDAQDSMGCTALHYAAQHAQPGLCEMLLGLGASPQVADAHGNTPLHYAAEEGCEPICRLLLERGADALARNAAGAAPADLARAAGYSELLSLLPQPAESEATADAAKLAALIDKFAAEGTLDMQRPYICGSLSREMAEHAQLCKAGVETAADFPYLLYYCVVCSNMNREITPAALDALLAAGADIDAADPAGATVFHWAVASAHGELCEQLMARGARTEGWPPLHLAAILGQTEECRALITAGTDPNLRNEAEWTPLMFAARFGREETCRALIAAGARVTETTAEGLGALHVAVERAHAEICRLLLEQGADATALYRNDVPPLHTAVGNGSAEVCRLLLEHGASANALRRGGVQEPALYWAIQMGDAEMCRLLLAAGAEVNVSVGDASTPLHAAAVYGNDEVTLLLLSAGANPDARNAYGLTPDELSRLEKNKPLPKLDKGLPGE